MGLKVCLFGFCLVVSSAFAAPSNNTIASALTTPSPAPQNAWSRVTYPTRGDADSVGFYSEGCIAGAQALPLDGPGFQVMRPSRNRFYGNPELLQFLQNLATNLDALESGLLIGDLGQPRGGPMPYGHASHQVGLDVDVWYWTHPEQRVRGLTVDERETLPMPTVLNANGVVDPAKFGREQILKLKMAADDVRVQRIFVNPAIKVYLCSSLDEKELSWLHKLRPWPGHDDHFHVRLYCPAGQKNCEAQEEQPAGDGCSEVLPPRKTSLLEGGGSLRSPTPELMDDEREDAHNDFLGRLLYQMHGMPAACAKILKL